MGFQLDQTIADGLGIIHADHLPIEQHPPVAFATRDVRVHRIWSKEERQVQIVDLLGRHALGAERQELRIAPPQVRVGIARSDHADDPQTIWRLFQHDLVTQTHVDLFPCLCPDNRLQDGLAIYRVCGFRAWQPSIQEHHLVYHRDRPQPQKQDLLHPAKAIVRVIDHTLSIDERFSELIVGLDEPTQRAVDLASFGVRELISADLEIAHKGVRVIQGL